jgi:ammonium transporter, Amt family
VFFARWVSKNPWWAVFRFPLFDEDVSMANRRMFGMRLTRKTFVLFVALAGGFLASRLVYSQAPATTPAEPSAATPAADAAAAPAADAAAPVSIPEYFDGHLGDSNGDGKVDEKDTSKWPDPTGAAAGYWATPSAGPVGDGDPSAMTPGALYDRTAHNLFSINFVWVLICGFIVMFMQSGFALVEGGL